MSMDGDPTANVPAGWFPDPGGTATVRWWDGASWTSELRAVVIPNPPSPPAEAASPAPAPAPAPAPSEPAERPYVPFQASAAMIRPTVTGISSTRTVWWIAFEPLWGVVTQVILFGLLNSFGIPPAAVIALVFTVLNAGIVVVLVALAFADRRALLAGGNQSAASPWWVLLTPLAYLIARSIEVAKWEVGAWTPLIWWIVSAVLAPGLAVLGYFAALGLFSP
jgi:hypothetical protein